MSMKSSSNADWKVNESTEIPAEISKNLITYQIMIMKW